jgi:hypothetical protein
MRVSFLVAKHKATNGLWQISPEPNFFSIPRSSFEGLMRPIATAWCGGAYVALVPDSSGCLYTV